MLKREKQFGVGKRIGNSIYFHKDYLTLFPKVLQNIQKISLSNFEFNIVKFSPKEKCASFILSPKFDDSYHPTITQSIKVRFEIPHDIKIFRFKNNLKIYHHRWMFVKDDYKGFDVHKDKIWSKLWFKVPDLNPRKYGNTNHWENITLVKIFNYYDATTILEIIEKHKSITI